MFQCLSFQSFVSESNFMKADLSKMEVSSYVVPLNQCKCPLLLKVYFERFR